MIKRVVLSLMLLATLTQAVPAQAIRGRVVEESGGGPVAGAIVEAHDAEGYLFSRRAVTSASGGFLLSLNTSGRYRVTVRSIGHRPVVRSNVDVGLSLLVLADIPLKRVVYTLPDLVAISTVTSCVEKGTDRTAFADLLDAMGASLKVIEQTVESGAIGFETEIVNRRIIVKRPDPRLVLDTLADTLRRELAYWPVQSLDVDSLRRFGFGIEKWEKGKGSLTLYGPDAAVLFSPWFLESHCFALDRPSAEGDSLLMRFAPPRRSQVADIAGELVFGAQDLTPRSLSFHFVSLPNTIGGIVPRSIGGELTFARTAGGMWYVDTWHMRSPLISARIRGGIYEIFGRVLSVLYEP